MKTKCTALTARGRPCRAWAVPGSDPPRCSAHGGRAHDWASPPLPSVRQPQSLDEIEQKLLEKLLEKLGQLEVYIQHHRADMTYHEYARMETLYLQTCEKIVRLRKEIQKLAEASNEVQRAFDEALDQLSLDWGVEL